MSRTIQVSDDDLYTIRWAINHGRDELALGHLARLLGEVEDAELPAPLVDEGVIRRPGGLKIALVVGHNARRKGAGAGSALANVAEYDFNSELADYLVEHAPDWLTFRRFRRHYHRSGGYSAEIAEVYATVDAWGPDLILELHFNGGRGDYTFQLAAQSATTSQAIARQFSGVFSRGLGIRDKGCKVCGKGDRGGASLFASRAPTLILEPFFGDNPDHCETVAALGIPGMATLYLEGCDEAAKLLI